MIHYIEGNQLSSEIMKIDKLIIAFFCMPDSIPCDMQNTILKEIEKEYSEFVEVFKILLLFQLQYFIMRIVKLNVNLVLLKKKCLMKL